MLKVLAWMNSTILNIHLVRIKMIKLFNICLFYFSLSSLTRDPDHSLSQPLFLFTDPLNPAHSLSQPLNLDHSPVTHSCSSLRHRPPCSSPKVHLAPLLMSDLASNLITDLSSELVADYSSDLTNTAADLNLNIAASLTKRLSPSRHPHLVAIIRRTFSP